MSWNLPPGCTDSDIDEAAPGYEAEPHVECEMCGHEVPKSDLIWLEPLTSMHWDSGVWLCPDCFYEREK